MTLPIDELIEKLLEFEGSDALGDGDFSVCLDAASTLTSLQERNRKLEEALAYIVNCDREGGPGLTDCIDNTGKRYQSASLAAALAAADALLSGAGE